MEIVQKPSPHHSSRRNATPYMVIVHADAGKSDAGTVSWIQAPESQVSYHWLVGRDGTVYQFVGEDRKAWHAGVSEWEGRKDLNPVSFGVAFANDGEESYRPVQYKAAGELVGNLIVRRRIRLDMVRGHFEVSPGRKHDPYSHFDWQTFYGWIGMYAAGRVS